MSDDTKPLLLTGASGFVGYHTALRLLSAGRRVIGVDNMNSYYDPRLKQARLARLESEDGFTFLKLDLADRSGVESLFQSYDFDQVIHLAAQAGVRYSIENPHEYGSSNLTAFLNILEGCRQHKISHLLYASSSSVYGDNEKQPFAVGDNVDYPISLYAATKKANELMAHSYSHLYDLPTTGLRFFTVYGPWGRPDMAYFLFTKAILAGEPIKIFNNGNMRRDFTYIDDIVEGVVRLLELPTVPVNKNTKAPYAVFNIGNNQPVSLMKFITTLEDALGCEAVKEYLPAQPGDVVSTFADIDPLCEAVGYRPDTPLDEGLAAFVEWYRHFYPDQVS